MPTVELDIRQLADEGGTEPFAPITVTDAVLDEDGNTLTDTISELNAGLMQSGHIGSQNYVKLFDGTLILWESVSVTARTYNVTFAIPFIAIGEGVITPTITASSGAGAGRGYVSVEDRTLTGFSIYKSYDGQQWIHWIAIGRWK